MVLLTRKAETSSVENASEVTGMWQGYWSKLSNDQASLRNKVENKLQIIAPYQEFQKQCFSEACVM